MVIRGGGDIQIAVTQADNGLDVSLETSNALPAGLVSDVVKRVAKMPFLRLSIGDEIVMERAKPIVTMGGTDVPIAPNPFLQAVATIEDKMAALVQKHLAKSKKVVVFVAIDMLMIAERIGPCNRIRITRG